MSHAGGVVTQVRGLYMMMGRGLEALAEVPAGCVAAIGGLGAAILKSATLASSPACRPLAPMLFQVGAAATQKCTDIAEACNKLSWHRWSARICNN